MPKATSHPDFSFEKKLQNKGYEFVAGVDEVGKGCFAGPLVTGCVIFPPFSRGPASRQPQIHPHRVTPALGLPALESPLEIPEDVVINDSKQVKPRQREKSAEWIKEHALAWGIGEVSAEKINHVGMAKAAKICFRQSISQARKRLGKPIDFLLADAFFVSYVPGLPARRRKNKKGKYYKNSRQNDENVHGRQQAIIDGDAKSISIAAASIIAKVYRDKLMQRLSRRPKYKVYGWGRNKGYGTREHQAAIKKYGLTRQHRKQWVETWQNKVKNEE